MDSPKFEGVQLQLGGRDLTVPALTLGQIKRLLPSIGEVMGMGETLTPQVATSVAKIVHAALSRNYPEMKEEEVEELIDLRNFRDVIDAVMGISGFEKKGEAQGKTSP